MYYGRTGRLEGGYQCRYIWENKGITKEHMLNCMTDSELLLLVKRLEKEEGCKRGSGVDIAGNNEKGDGSEMKAIPGLNI